MSEQIGSLSRPAATVSSMPPSPEAKGRTDVWAIVLAGGEGVRLRPLLREVIGDERPKQYAKLLGDRTLLRQTLDRVGIAIRPECTMLVTMRLHARYIAEEFPGSGPTPHLLAQPCDRGTAAAILYAATRIVWRCPEAMVAIFPSDHFILGEATFMGYVAELTAWVRAHPERLVLVGARPTSPEVEYGWVEPGEQLGDVSTGPVHTVRQFWEKPSLGRAERCLAAGYLWNTSVIVGKASTVLHLGARGLPAVTERLAQLERVVGTPDEAWAIQQAFELLPKANFSRAVLEACPDALAVSRLPRLAWSDLGNPRRVMEVVNRMRIRPAWATTLLPLRDAFARETMPATSAAV